MPFYNKPAAFVLAASDHGPLIVNHYDINKNENGFYGLGYQILETGSYDHEDIQLLITLLSLRKEFYPGTVVVLDCGANIGVHTIEFGRYMTGWGFVFAVEAQERLFYALAGNVALNNLFNAKVIHGAISDKSGNMLMPKVNYNTHSAFGALELINLEKPEHIGQDISYKSEDMVEVQTYSIDSFGLDRVDVIKLDIEGMELMALEGAKETLEKHKPALWIERFKASEEEMRKLLEGFGYKIFDSGMNILAVHKEDKCIEHIQVQEKKIEEEKPM